MSRRSGEYRRGYWTAMVHAAGFAFGFFVLGPLVTGWLP